VKKKNASENHLSAALVASSLECSAMQEFCVKTVSSRMYSSTVLKAMNWSDFAWMLKVSKQNICVPGTGSEPVIRMKAGRLLTITRQCLRDNMYTLESSQSFSDFVKSLPPSDLIWWLPLGIQLVGHSSEQVAFLNSVAPLSIVRFCQD